MIMLCEDPPIGLSIPTVVPSRSFVDSIPESASTYNDLHPVCALPVNTMSIPFVIGTNICAIWCTPN